MWTIFKFFGRKEATQDEFFYTFNELYESQKQIVDLERLTTERDPAV